MTRLSKKVGWLQTCAEAADLLAHLSEIEVEGVPVAVLTLAEREPVKMEAQSPEAIRRELLKRISEPVAS